MNINTLCTAVKQSICRMKVEQKMMCAKIHHIGQLNWIKLLVNSGRSNTKPEKNQRIFCVSFFKKTAVFAKILNFQWQTRPHTHTHEYIFVECQSNDQHLYHYIFCRLSLAQPLQLCYRKNEMVATNDQHLNSRLVLFEKCALHNHHQHYRRTTMRQTAGN